MQGIKGAPNSVHLSDWPSAANDQAATLERENTITAMEEVRNAVTEGLSQRAKAGIKVRQPLQQVSITGVELKSALRDIVAEELNVKKVVSQKGSEFAIEVDMTITEDLKQEGLVRDIMRQIQEARKQAGLDVDNRIALSLRTENQIMQDAITKFKDEIMTETLALSLDASTVYAFETTVRLGDAELIISLERTKQ